MTNLYLQEIEKKLAAGTAKNVPILRPGYQVRIHQKIKEGEKERIQVFEGLVIGLNSGLGSSKTVTVRKVVEGIGVEKIFPLYSPNLAKIEVKKTFGVRRAKLYYLRNKEGLSSRLSAKLGMIEKDEKHRARSAMVAEAAVEAGAAVAAGAEAAAAAADGVEVAAGVEGAAGEAGAGEAKGAAVAAGAEGEAGAAGAEAAAEMASTAAPVDGAENPEQK